MPEAGISRDANERVMTASEFMATMMEFDMPLDRLYLDPLLLPIGVAQPRAMEAMEAVTMFEQLNQDEAAFRADDTIAKSLPVLRNEILYCDSYPN